MKERSSRRTLALLKIGATVAMVALVAAAGGGNDGSQTADSTPGGTQGVGSADTSPDVVQNPTAQPKTGGNLVFALDSETDGWDPTQNRWANAVLRGRRRHLRPARRHRRAVPGQALPRRVDHAQRRLHPVGRQAPAEHHFLLRRAAQRRPVDGFIKGLQKSALTSAASRTSRRRRRSTTSPSGSP